MLFAILLFGALCVAFLNTIHIIAVLVAYGRVVKEGRVIALATALLYIDWFIFVRGH